MTLEERNQLQNFLQQLTQARAEPKDIAAETLIKDACSQQPDALYLLVQRAMGTDMALQVAMAKNAELQAKVDQAATTPASSFLSGGNSWGRQPTAPIAQTAAFSNQSAPARNMQPQAAPVAQSSWGSGMMGTIASTAVGVVAGSFLYQGIQNMMGHHGPSNDQSNSLSSNNSDNGFVPIADEPSNDSVADYSDDVGGDDLA
ncbi:MAG: DUF2076 domain-containing protein [Burkholderiaceae bacterium]